MSKPNYRVQLTFDGERKVFLARAPELEHCSAEGATRGEALTNMEKEIDAQLANMLSHGTTPRGSVDEEIFSGEITARVSKGLHRELAYQARSEGVELDQLLGELLASAAEARRSTGRNARSGNRAEHDGGNRNFDGNRRQAAFGRNAAILDDRANFIEYVRGLEQGQQGPSHGAGGYRGGPGHNNNSNNNNNQGAGRRRGRGGGGGGGGGRGPHTNTFRNPSDHRAQQGGGPPAAGPAPVAASPAPVSNGGNGGGNNNGRGDGSDGNV